MKLTTLICIILVIVLVAMIASYSLSSHPCDYCSNTPTKSYKLSSREKFYACSECRSTCAFCGNKASKHFKSSRGVIVFACKDCYINESID